MQPASRPVDKDGRPLIVKLGTIDCDMVEATTIVWKGHVWRGEWVRNQYYKKKALDADYFRFVNWEPSPLNPVLRFSDDDKKIANPALSPDERERIAAAENVNNSDMDFAEHDGRLIFNYSWGNQRGIEFLAEATYEGTQERFLRGWFPW